MERLRKLYQQHVGTLPEDIVLMDKSGSNRQYYRLTGTPSIVGVIGESREENDAFIYMGSTSASRACRSPRSMA